jgi:hypothetical protein
LVRFAETGSYLVRLCAYSARHGHYG